MSTRSLLGPENIHEPCNDLASFWFVLHFVKHNKSSGIRIATIFDSVYEYSSTGDPSSGLGKRILYPSLLFRSPSTYHTAQCVEEMPSDTIIEATKRLESREEITRLFKEALRSEGWPESRGKVED